jgi:hypothetical protein
MLMDADARGNGRTVQAMGLDEARANALVDAARRRAGVASTEIDDRERRRTDPPRLHRDGESELSFAIDVFGVRIGVSLADASLLNAVVDRLPPGWQPAEFARLDEHYRFEVAPGPGGDYALRTGQFDIRRSSWEGALEAFDSLAEDYVAEHARPWLFLHAGVVAWRGQAIVLAGNSFSGKSTLVTALVGAGAEYYSDEFAVLDRNGWVHPYPRRIALRRSVRDGGWEHQRVSVTTDRWSSALRQPLPVGVVALLSYGDYGNSWAKCLDLASGVMALCSHTVAVRQRPADAFAVLGTLARSATVIRGERGEAEDAASWLLHTDWRDFQDTRVGCDSIGRVRHDEERES